LLAQPERLARLLTHPERPVQLIIAGKAHPRDEEGKHLIQQWAQFAALPEARAHVVFLDDYDMGLAAELVQGVDVWINTPRRPWEASGTSGMKVLVNGGLNLSTLDGWWSEAFAPDYGWALGDRIERPDDDAQEAAQLYSLLEQEIVPAFYERDAEGLPRRWIARMRASMAALAPRFSSVRMLQEYIETAYVPSATSYRRRAADAAAVARTIEQWSRRLGQHWIDIRFGEIIEKAGRGRFTLSVPVFLGEITPEDVHVELFANPENANDAFVQQMRPVEPIAGVVNAFIYSTTVETVRPAWSFTPRVVPFHPDARVPIELPLIAWQR
jgi:starch phosphorylase